MLYITNIFPLMESYGKWSPPTPRYGKFQTKNAVIYSLHVFMLFITSIYGVVFNFEGGGAISLNIKVPSGTQ